MSTPLACDPHPPTPTRWYPLGSLRSSFDSCGRVRDGVPNPRQPAGRTRLAARTSIANRPSSSRLEPAGRRTGKAQAHSRRKPAGPPGSPDPRHVRVRQVHSTRAGSETSRPNAATGSKRRPSDRAYAKPLSKQSDTRPASLPCTRSSFRPAKGHRWRGQSARGSIAPTGTRRFCGSMTRCRQTSPCHGEPRVLRENRALVRHACERS